MGLLSSPMSALWEKKPKVPNFQRVDPIAQQGKITQGNLNNLPAISQLGSQTNDFMRGERLETLGGIPGFADIQDQTASNIKNWLLGDIGDDLAGNVMRRANAKAFSGGYGRSGMANNLTARDLGLTGLQLQQSAVPMGQNFLNSSLGLYGTPEFSPTSMFINPMQAAEMEMQQNAGQFNRDWLSNRIKAQPDPWQQNLMGTLDQNEMLLNNMIADYGSSAAKGGGGGSY